MNKSWYYLLTALGTLASSYFFNFLFFLLGDRFGYTDEGNLWVAALHGAVYIGAAVHGGRFAERRGYHTSLLAGFGGLTVCLAAGAFVTTAAGLLVLVAVYTVVLLFTWPALEALVVQGEPPGRVPDRVGLYNCTWSGTAAVAYFTGGPLYDAMGAAAIFVVPSLLCLAATVIVLRLSRRPVAAPALPPESRAAAPVVHPEPAARLQPVSPETFLRLAWIANPLSYLAIYALLAVMPGLAARFELSASWAGMLGSVWFFARLAAFFGLWHWTGWHYRFRWMTAGYVTLSVSFAVILLSPSLAVVIVAEMLFGLGTGLIYYSSLFYSMDVGTARAEHGGFHEAMIGVGICAGPAVGALSLRAFPGHPAAGAVAVGACLVVGFGVILSVWRLGSRGAI